MNITVCELPDGWSETDDQWNRLKAYLQATPTDMLLLPEMPFYPWLSRTKDVDPDQWTAAVAAHDRWIERLGELGTPAICGTRPVIKDGRRYNEGFVWQPSAGYRSVHTKYYLPDDDGFWEATWYERGLKEFRTVTVDGVTIGFLICTEIWFNVWARDYAKQGIDLLVCPRAAPTSSTDTWIAGARTAAVVSGAFCLSSNFTGPVTDGITFGGAGWIVEPAGGTVVGLTDADQPFLTIDVDLQVARKAKTTYPRYVKD